LRDSKICDALVIPPPSRDYYGSVAIILKNNVYAPSHRNGEILLRQMVKIQGHQEPIDPFDFEYGRFHE
jgi:hypothetical protein